MKSKAVRLFHVHVTASVINSKKPYVLHRIMLSQYEFGSLILKKKNLSHFKLNWNLSTPMTPKSTF